MALSHSTNAIGAVSTLLRTNLRSNTEAIRVDVGSPEESAKGEKVLKYNLFLYQVEVDGHLKNVPLDTGQTAPIWLVLHYLLTAFDGEGYSDSENAHELLGEGMLALQELNFINPSSVNALMDNPEPLKVSFNSADSDMISKIMQGSDEKYRVSAAFQIRPVMIAPSVPPTYSLPVKTVGPPNAQGVVVVPSLGPVIDPLEPQFEKFIAGTAIAITGSGIGSYIDEIRLGAHAFPLIAAKEGEIIATINEDTAISAGSYPLTVIRHLPGNKILSSNAILARLLPTIAIVTPAPAIDHGDAVSGTLLIEGNNLGENAGSIFAVFYHDGVVSKLFNAEVVLPQTQIQIEIKEKDKVAAGQYFLVLRVNGEQSISAFEVDWSL